METKRINKNKFGTISETLTHQVSTKFVGFFEILRIGDS